jgi:hypothetical protein
MILQRGCSSPVPQLHRDQPGGTTVGCVDSDLYRRCTLDKAAIVDVPAVGGAIRDITLGHLGGIDAVAHRLALSKTRWDLDLNLTFKITIWVRSTAHAQDIARAFLAVLDGPRDQAFNTGSTTENDQMRQLAEIVAETVRRCPVELASGASPDTRPRALSSWRLTACPPAAHGQPGAVLPFGLTARTPSRPRHGMRRTEEMT